MMFSICIPAHRNDQRFYNTINSLRDLNYDAKSIEVCILFNGDSKLDIGVQKILPYELKFKHVSNKLGPSTAKNMVIDMASNDYVVLLDSDDFLVPSSLKQFESVLQKTPDIAIGYEFSSINILDGISYFPPNRYAYVDFVEQQIKNSKNSGAFGRPVIINKTRFVGFDPQFGYAEERKLALDTMMNKQDIHIMTTLSYVYNINSNGILRDDFSIQKIKDIIADVDILYKIVDTNFFIDDADIHFIDRVSCLERLNT